MSERDFSYSNQRLRSIATELLDHARARGASACEADVSEGFGQSVTVRRGEIETIEYTRDKGAGITVYLGQRRGYASTSDLGRNALHAAVDAALAIARYTTADPCAGLPEADELARDAPDLDLFHPWDVPVEDMIEIARRCEAAAFAVSPLVTNSEGASVSTQRSHFVSANSLGFMGGYASSRHYLSCSVIAGKGEAMQRDDWYSGRRDARELAPAETLGEYCARRALSRLGARRLSTREVPVLFEAPLAATLIGNFVHAASGGSLYRKASFLLDRLGTPVFSPCVRISERPHLARGLASSPFDDDGVATRDREVIRDGVLEGYFLGVYSARKLGLKTTGNAGGCHNLIVQPGAHDLDGLIRLMDRGLLVTELLGHGVNYVTGDYSRGAAGYWVERGEIQYPVQEITIAGNLDRMLRDIVAAGNDAIIRGSKQVGSLLLAHMTVAGA